MTDDLTKEAVALGVAIYLTRYIEEVPALTDLLERCRRANPAHVPDVPKPTDPDLRKKRAEYARRYYAANIAKLRQYHSERRRHRRKTSGGVE